MGGAGALAAMAGMSAYYLSKRREEEEAQRRAVQEQVAAKNAALRAKEAQMREQAKIENYLQGKAMLEAALKDSNLSDEAKAAIKEHAKTNGMAAGLQLTAAAVGALNAPTGKIEPPRNGGPKVLQAPLSGGPITVIAVLLLILAAAATIITAYRSHKVDGVCDPKRTLASCFDKNGRMKFFPEQQIDRGEFDDLLEAVYKDINKTPRLDWDPSRANYDTPFFTGNSHFEENKYPDNIVCIGDRCDHQSHVNSVNHRFD